MRLVHASMLGALVVLALGVATGTASPLMIGAALVSISCGTLYLRRL